MKVCLTITEKILLNFSLYRGMEIIFVPLLVHFSPHLPLSLATYMKVLVMDCVLTLAMGSDQCVSQPG